MKLWRKAAIISVLSTVAVAQIQHLPTFSTEWVNCISSSPHTIKAVSPTLESPISHYRARVEVRSVPANDGSQCRNYTTLWTSTSSVGYRRTFRQLPINDYLGGNGMRLIDWSPDGRLLLVELWIWNTMPNDAGVDKQILVINPEDHSKTEISLGFLMDDQKGRDCMLNVETLGFTPDGRVTARTHLSTFNEPGDTEEDVPSERRCHERTEVWAISPATQAQTRLADDFVVSRYRK